MTYDFFFRQATQRHPYHYQQRLACGEPFRGQAESEWLSQSGPCASGLISIPTGLGKTAATVLAWLWNRVHCQNSGWPRRLIFCLPMRTLVEQTEREVSHWLDALGLSWDGEADSRHGKVGVHLLMGGEEKEDWDLYPEENAILIGTQDMLLSRALNRGYGMSRYRWPMHFALLSNDCLWVLDETQLMGVGVETSAQLDGFRHHAQWLRHAPCPTWWMSATLEDSRLATVDHPRPDSGWPRLELDQVDRQAVEHRLAAGKQLHQAGIAVARQTNTKDLAKLVLDLHVPGHLTLVIVNRVSRAQELYQSLQKLGRSDHLALVHSRFRPLDRQAHQDLLIQGNGDRIVVATQAVEAGVDVSARVLITELAPWPSLVQRFGRCNRGGEFNDEGADIHWLDLQFEKDAEVAPYTLQELKDARAELEKLEGTSVSPEALSAIQVALPSIVRPVIRRKDLVDLFDTTPDIAGHDLDISRYIRDGEDTDVQVFWRDLSSSGFTPPSGETQSPTRRELCRVGVHAFQGFLDKLKKAGDDRSAYVWDGLNERWKAETKSRTGAVYLLDRRAGGYDAQLGWTGNVAALKKESEWTPVVSLMEEEPPDAAVKDPLTLIGRTITLSEHTSHVVERLESILGSLSLPTEWVAALRTAAVWHDVGKSHPAFQTMLRKAAGSGAPTDLLAKSGTRGGSLPAWRRHFRHELASALAWLAHHDGSPDADLTAYLIAAHHGKVRLSIRSMPGEAPENQHQAGTLMARGIVDGDELPELSLNSLSIPATTLRLDLMRMGTDDQGRPSWLSRMITLRDQLGPFTLAYLETLLRAADMRASADEARTPSTL